MTSAKVDSAPLASTPAGDCIEERFRAMHIPAFHGSPVTVGKTIVLR